MSNDKAVEEQITVITFEFRMEWAVWKQKSDG